MHNHRPKPSRALSNDFFLDLQEHGLLYPLIEEVRQDCTLLLALRGSYITVYYRGGALLKVEELGTGSYKPQFDYNYGLDPAGKQTLPKDLLPSRLDSSGAVLQCLEALPFLKRAMDHFLARNDKLEREYQQLLVRENNRSRLANETEYFVTDIEYSEADARFDMLGVRWLSSERQSGGRLVPVIIEMKVGKDSLGGLSGLLAHLKDIEERLANHESRNMLIDNVLAQFDLLTQLGLLHFNRSKLVKDFRLAADSKPLVVLILAGYNPRSSVLSTTLGEIEAFMKDERNFELRFFTASFAGYALHDANMLDLGAFRALVSSLQE